MELNVNSIKIIKNDMILCAEIIFNIYITTTITTSTSSSSSSSGGGSSSSSSCPLYPMLMSYCFFSFIILNFWTGIVTCWKGFLWRPRFLLMMSFCLSFGLPIYHIDMKFWARALYTVHVSALYRKVERAMG